MWPTKKDYRDRIMYLQKLLSRENDPSKIIILNNEIDYLIMVMNTKRF